MFITRFSRPARSRTFPFFRHLAMLAVLLAALPAQAERIKQLGSFQGVRDNPLIGYGLIVGLDGSGDSTQQTPFTIQSLTNMLSQLGVTLPPGSNMQLKNVASVIVTATLPPFARPGQTIDITVSSLGNAKSLRGGTLLMTPLKGADGQVYALAQGNMVIGGAGASANGNSVKINQLSAGRIPAGAIVERAVLSPIAANGTLLLELNQSDFGTAQKTVTAINDFYGAGTAIALDGRVISINTPENPQEKVAFLAGIENIDVTPSKAVAKVVINARTGSIVMNQAVRIEDCAVAHGNLTVVIKTQPAVSQPNALAGGETVVAPVTQIEISQEGSALQVVRAGASLADVVKGLNALGANPQDLVSILQAMKAIGALRADLEII
jgi:flagellar P-ring protein precursor FlgI